MAIRVDVNVDNTAALLDAAAYGSGALLRLERAPDEAGAYSEILTLPLVAGTDAYTFWDATGTPTSWYRSRVSSVSETSVSGYSDPFQFGELLAYAEVDDLLELMPQTTGSRNLNFLADCLVRASGLITARCKRDFYRHPQVSGTETRYYRTQGGDTLTDLNGIVSLTTVEYASEFGGTWTALGAENTDWYFDWPVPDTTSYLQVRLPSSGALGRWHEGPRRARLTGVFGFATVPGVIKSGTLALAREFVTRSLGAAGSPTGMYDTPSALLPTETFMCIEWGSHLARGMAA